MIGVLMAAVLAMAGAPADPPLVLDLPPIDVAPGSSCKVTVVEVEPQGRLVVFQTDAAPPPGQIPKLRRFVTTLAGLPRLLATMPNRCQALVTAASNAPVNAVKPVYAAMQTAGFKYFGTVDGDAVGPDPRWERR